MPKKNIFSIILIILFLILEKPSIIYRLSGIQASDLSIILKLFFYGAISIIWIICSAAIFFVAHSRSSFKWPAFILIIIPIFIFDTFVSVSNDPLLFGDYLVLRLSIANFFDAIHEYYRFLLYPFIRSLLLLWAFLICHPNYKNAEIKASCLLFFSIIVFSGVCYAKKGTATDKIPGFLSVYGFEIAMFLDSRDHSYNHDGILFEPTTKPRKDNILLVIDESVRYDFINGEDPSPGLNILSNLNWNVYDYGSATSGNNCSAFSNLILRKGPRPNTLGVDVEKKPLIWSYAKKAGFKTILIDAQNAGKNHDYFDDKELKMIDNNVDTKSYSSDRDIAKALKKILISKGNFIIIIKKGAHFKYTDRYPKTFSPNFKSNYINEKQNRIEYARAISFQTGGFFEELFSAPIKPETLIIYTSDHGQNLKDLLGMEHCTATGTPYQGEGMVPMLIIDNQNNKQVFSSTQFNHNKTSHFNIFSTLLYYLGYDNNDYLKHYEPSLFEPVKRLGSFGYGSPFGYFSSTPKFRLVSETLEHTGVKK